MDGPSPCVPRHKMPLSDPSREQRATDLAAGVSQTAAALAEEQTKRAEALAYAKGAEDARTAAHFENIDKHLIVVNGSIADTGRELKRMGAQLTTLELQQDKRDAISTALAAAVKLHNTQQISLRQFALGVAMVIISLGGLLVGLR